MAYSPKHILITGAGGAIGGELARRTRKRWPGVRFTLVDISQENLNQLAGQLSTGSGRNGADQFGIETCDLTNIDALPDWWADVVVRRGAVDTLINCAGVMDIISLEHTGWERARMLLDINLTAPLRLIDLALPHMTAQRSGCIVNFASMAGKVPIRGCTYYGGAKAGLAHASEILRNEVADSGVQVTTVYPGPIYSGLESHARSQVQQGLVSKLIPTGKPGDIAQLIVEAIANNHARVIHPRMYRTAYDFIQLSTWVTARLSPQPKR